MNPPATWLSYASPPVSARQVLSFSHRCSEQDFEWLVICTRGNLHQAAQHQDSKQNRRPHAHLPPRSQHIRAFFRSYFRSAASRLQQPDMAPVMAAFWQCAHVNPGFNVCRWLHFADVDVCPNVHFAPQQPSFKN
jgi:hypothetical protein